MDRDVFIHELLLLFFLVVNLFSVPGDACRSQQQGCQGGMAGSWGTKERWGAGARAGSSGDVSENAPKE